MEQLNTYPENATDPERKIDWQKIVEITDADFGFTTPKEKNRQD